MERWRREGDTIVYTEDGVRNALGAIDAGLTPNLPPGPFEQVMAAASVEQKAKYEEGLRRAQRAYHAMRPVI